MVDWPQASRRPARALSSFAFGALLGLASGAAVVVSGLITHRALLGEQPVGWREATLTGAMAVAVGIARIRSLDTDPEAVRHAIRHRWHGLDRLTGLAVCVLTGAFALTVSGHGEPEHELRWGLLFVLCAGVLLLGVNLAARAAEPLLRPLRIALVGTAAARRDVIERLQRRPSSRHVVVAAIDPALDVRRATSLRAGSVDLLIDLIRIDAVDAVLIDPTGLRRGCIDELLVRLKETPVEIRFACRPYGAGRAQGPVLAGAAVAQTRVRRPTLAGWSGVAKRTEDVVFALLLVLCCVPLLALIALAVKCDGPGPVLFRQRRYGFNNQVIEILKFRSMRHSECDVAGAIQALPGDCRITPLGRILRRFSLDELPQLFNVIGGSMSIVGPRPHALWTRTEGILFDEAVLGYAGRHNVKPGITGLAQIRGWRGPTRSVGDLEQRLACDLAYIERWSLHHDVAILFATVPALFRTKNAC